MEMGGQRKVSKADDCHYLHPLDHQMMMMMMTMMMIKTTLKDYFITLVLLITTSTPLLCTLHSTPRAIPVKDPILTR